jgi:hypothetical protein
MIRERIILAAILGVVLGSPPASAVCTPAEVIRERFAHVDGAAPAIVSNPRYVAAVTQALQDTNAVASAIGDRYLVVGIGGMLLVYPVRDGQICAAGREGMAAIMGQAAKDLVKRFQEIGQAP